MLNNWWDRMTFQMHLGFVYNDVESLNGKDIFGKEIAV